MGQPEEAQAPAIAERVLSPHAVELLFWGGVLVILGYFLYLPGGLHIAPWARLGRMLLLLGGAFTYGSLRRTPLAGAAAFLLAMCVLQALLMVGLWVGYIFHIGAGRLLAPAMIARLRCTALGLDLAVVLALLLLLHAAGRASRLGFALGVAFFPVVSLALLAAPLVLGDPFWVNALKTYARESAQGPAMALQIALTVFALIVLIKLYRLTHGPAGTGAG